ncbi:MAG: hypothetical protein ACI9TK_000808 [Flavobacteriaceae bacterium]|jgi:uncharacterized protein YqgC (DUF456 family)|tara:strand:+ start:3753 stop:4265 length:513 start_codon:yes stop_codon:yes gene_type:complete
MDVLFITLAGFFIFLGIAGSFLPIIPGPMSSWIGILMLSFAPSIATDKTFLMISFFVALFIYILDNIIPVLGSRKFGGGKGSTIGSSIGLVMGVIFLGPLGLLIGPFMGAFLGELYVNQDNKKGALKAAIGALLGFVTGVFLKFMVSLAFSVYYLKILWDFKNILFFKIQ